MSTYSRVKSWSSNETLTSTDLNAEFNNIITNTNSGNLNSDNVSTSAAWTWTGTHIMSTSSKLALIDNIYLTLGSATDGDYFLRYSASNTALELSTTNADGSGTNAVVVDIQDGTDDVRVRGGFSTDNNTAPTTGIKVGGNVLSDTDSTDDLGTTSVRWANVYTDAVGDSGQTLGVKATTLSFDAASTIDTSGNNALTLDAGTAVLTLDGGTLESDATTLSFDAAATIDTSGNNALSLDAGSAVLTLDGGTLESDASTFSFDAAATIDTSGNNNLTLSAGTGTLVATAGDMTLFDDNNNADVSLSLGTSATEALVIQALNGGSNKTLEELRFTTKTASGTGDHGKISFHIDEEEIATIDDGGIDLASGLSFTVAGSAIGGSVAADNITTGDGAVSLATTSGNITIDAQANDADVIIKVDDNGSAVTALTLDGSDEGNAIFVNDVQLKSDGALLEFGADLDTTLTHTDGTGLTLNSTNKLTFGDAASFIQQSADGTLRIDGEAIIDLNASTRVDVSGDLKVGGEVQTASIGYTDGDNAMTIADGGGVTFPQATAFSGDVSMDGGSFTFNESGADKDFRIEGDTEQNLFVADASADSIGIGVAAPSAALEIYRDDTAVTDQLRISQDGTGDAAMMFHQVNEQGWYLGIDNSDSDTFYINTGSGNTSNGINIRTAGQLGIGASVANANQGVGLHICTADASATVNASNDELILEGNTSVGMSLLTDSDGVARITWGHGSGTDAYSGQIGYYNDGDYMNFLTASTERWRITSTGQLTPSHRSSMADLEYININTSSTACASPMIALASNTTSSAQSTNGVIRIHQEQTAHANFRAFCYTQSSSNTQVFRVMGDGDCENANNSYGSTSDLKLKTDITDARSYWDDFKQLQFKRFRFKTDVAENANAPYRFGLIAQEVEPIFPSIVKNNTDIQTKTVAVLDDDGNATYETTGEIGDDGELKPVLDDDGNKIPITKEETTLLETSTKSLKYSVLSQIGLKVVQELQTRLEAAEAKIAALESA